MTRVTSRKIWILAASTCLLLAVFLGFSSSNHIQVDGLTPSDIAEIRSVVRQENLQRWPDPRLQWAPIGLQKWAANLSHPIKSIDVTTNNLHALFKRVLLERVAMAATNLAVEVQRWQMRFCELRDAETNEAVQVWFKDKKARYGKAGYTVEKGSNGWKMTVQHSR